MGLDQAHPGRLHDHQSTGLCRNDWACPGTGDKQGYEPDLLRQTVFEFEWLCTRLAQSALTFCAILGATWLTVTAGVTLSAYAKSSNYQSQKGTPFQFSHAVIVQPTFHQVRTSGCSNTSNDFPSNSLPRPNFPNEHYRVLTINSGSRGQKCDQLSWNVLLGVPAAPTSSCVFILYNAGVDPTHSGTLRFFDVTKNPI